MRIKFIPLAILCGLMLGGCQGSGAVKPEAVSAEAAKPALSEEARQELAKAEIDVKEAKARKALWTTAEDALKKAKESAAKFDSAATLKHSKMASELARLGIAQLSYPLAK
ncbi:MAG: hypothetical protein LLG15_11960 [Betaproteobacteria bacterium]|nr:hypothetical protein [Betaproteobacteria bacterium]